jgi:hypothetical protein
MKAHTGPRLRQGRLLPLALIAALLTVPGCTVFTGPNDRAALLVVNATCDPGPCLPLTVTGFPANQPHTPGGFWSVDIGFVYGASACLTIPESGSFDVLNADSGAKTTYTWKEDEPLALAAIEAHSSFMMSQPTTGEFVPTRSAGWRVTLPGDGAVTADRPCDPDTQP